MKSLPGRIMGYAETKPEATPIQAEDLLHLGGRAAVSGRSPASRVPSDSCGSTVAFTCAPSRPDLGFARRVWSKPAPRSRASGVRPSCSRRATWKPPADLP